MSKLPPVFTTIQACEYISAELAKRNVTLTESSVRRHLLEKKAVPATKLNATAQVYLKKDLDAFVEKYAQNPKKRGRQTGWRKKRE